PLIVRLFGPPALRVGGEPPPRLRSRKGLWLLSLLVLRGGREVDRSWMAGTLWPESTHEQALAYLRQSLHDLRRALGSAGCRIAAPTPRVLRFELEGADVDLTRFDAAIRRGDTPSLTEAVELYAGP